MYNIRYMALLRILSTYLAFFLFFFVVALGPWTVLSLPIDIDPGCLITHGQESLCSMSSLEHLQQWQNVFVLIVLEILAFIALGLAASSWMITLVRQKVPLLSFRGSGPPTLFQILFAQGLLNSKAY